MQRITINGICAEYLSTMDRGLHYGDGLFETIACVDGGLQFWSQHLQRMRAGAEVLNITFPGDEAFLEDIRQQHNVLPHTKSVIKLMLTRGQGRRGYRVPGIQKPARIVISTDWPATSDKPPHTGASLCLCRHPVSVNPSLAGIKHLNRLDSVIARSEWHDEYHEGLMTDSEGSIIEGTMSNVFAVSNGKLFTPGLERCGVDGIIRNQVLDIAEENNIKVKSGTISVDDLYSMDEIFISNSVIGIWPVTRFVEHSYALGKTTQMLANALQQRVLKHAKKLD